MNFIVVWVKSITFYDSSVCFFNVYVSNVAYAWAVRDERKNENFFGKSEALIKSYKFAAESFLPPSSLTTYAQCTDKKTYSTCIKCDKLCDIFGFQCAAVNCHFGVIKFDAPVNT